MCILNLKLNILGWVIFQVLLEGGKGLVRVDKVTKEEKEYLKIFVDKSKVKTVGLKAMGDFLLKLQVILNKL